MMLVSTTCFRMALFFLPLFALGGHDSASSPVGAARNDAAPARPTDGLLPPITAASPGEAAMVTIAASPGEAAVMACRSPKLPLRLRSSSRDLLSPRAADAVSDGETLFPADHPAEPAKFQICTPSGSSADLSTDLGSSPFTTNSATPNSNEDSPPELDEDRPAEDDLSDPINWYYMEDCPRTFTLNGDEDDPTSPRDRFTPFFQPEEELNAIRGTRISRSKKLVFDFTWAEDSELLALLEECVAAEKEEGFELGSYPLMMWLKKLAEFLTEKRRHKVENATLVRIWQQVLAIEDQIFERQWELIMAKFGGYRMEREEVAKRKEREKFEREGGDDAKLGGGGGEEEAEGGAALRPQTSAATSISEARPARSVAERANYNARSPGREPYPFGEVMSQMFGMPRPGRRSSPRNSNCARRHCLAIHDSDSPPGGKDAAASAPASSSPHSSSTRRLLLHPRTPKSDAGASSSSRSTHTSGICDVTSSQQTVAAAGALSWPEVARPPLPTLSVEAKNTKDPNDYERNVVEILQHLFQDYRARRTEVEVEIAKAASASSSYLEPQKKRAGGKRGEMREESAGKTGREDGGLRDEGGLLPYHPFELESGMEFPGIHQMYFP